MYAASIVQAMARRSFHSFTAAFTENISPYLPLLSNIWQQHASSSELRTIFGSHSHQSQPEFLTRVRSESYLPAESTDEIKPYKRALSQVVANILRHYCPNLEALEIGSGTFPITEFLLGATEEEKGRIQLSDMSPLCIDSLRTQYPQARVDFFDILSDDLPEQSYPCVVMSDLFNVFSKEEIEIASRNMNKILTPGGYLIHFSIRNGLIEHTLNELKSPDSIYLPLINSHGEWEGVYVMNYSELGHFIGSLKPEHRYLKDCLAGYSSLDLNQCDILCQESLTSDHLDIFRTLYEEMQQLNCPAATTVLFKERHHERMQQVLESSPFQIIQCEEMEGHYLTTSLYQMLSCKGAFYPTSCTQLLPQRHMKSAVVQKRATVHVLVAQKPRLQET